MSVKVLVNGQMKVVADVISPGAITKIAAVSYIYTGAEWLECDGSTISRTTYADLFAAIGTTFGSGDGVNTFNIPTQAQANRVTFEVVSDTVLAQFTCDADVVVNNPSAAYVDIGNGATGPGLRISIIEQSDQGITVYTDTAHMQSYLLYKGILELEWDGAGWVCVSLRAAPSPVLFTSNSTYKAPFSGLYKLFLQGGGGAGGGSVSDAESGTTGGGGGGGSPGQVLIQTVHLLMGQSYALTVGTGGSNGSTGSGASGNSTTFVVGDVTYNAYGGYGGIGATYLRTGSAGEPSMKWPLGADCIIGGSGESGVSSYGGAGGPSRWGPGGARKTSVGNGNSAPSSSYGAGGGGAYSTTSSGSKIGSSGAAGCVEITPVV